MRGMGLRICHTEFQSRATGDVENVTVAAEMGLAGNGAWWRQEGAEGELVPPSGFLVYGSGRVL